MPSLNATRCTSQRAGGGNLFTENHMPEPSEGQVLAKVSGDKLASYTLHIKTQQIVHPESTEP